MTARGDQRCRRLGGGNWQCKELRMQGYTLCEKHQKQRLKLRLKKQIKKAADFSEGQQVEVGREDEGFKDSWFTANILKLANKHNRMVVEYDRLLAKVKGKKPLKESVDPCLVRPLPPPQPPNQSFQLEQCVDAFYSDGWWKGEVIEVLDNNRYTVHFPVWEEKIKFGADKLRLHLDWVGGTWVSPQNREDHQRKKDGSSKSLERKKQTDQCLRKPNKKLRKETGESSSSPITTRQRAMSVRSNIQSTKARQALHQENRRINQNETDIFSSPSSRFSVRVAQNLSDPKSDANSNLSDGAEQTLCKDQRSLLQKCSGSQSQVRNKDSVGGDMMINQNREVVANQTIAISETKGCNIVCFESTLEDPQEETPARDVAHVIQGEFALQGTEIQTLSYTDSAPHSVSSFSLLGNPQSREDHQRKKDGSSKSLKRKKQTDQCLRKPNKKLRKEIGESSSSPITTRQRAMSARSNMQSTKTRQSLHQENRRLTQNETDIFSSPSSRFSVRLAQNLSDPKSEANSNLSDGAQQTLCKDQISLLQKCSGSQSQECNKDSVGGDMMINQNREGVANQTIAISETKGCNIVCFESTLEDPQEKTSAREVAHVVQGEFALEGTEIQTLSYTDSAPHSVSSFSLLGNPQSRDVDAADTENRKMWTKRGRGGPPKKQHKEEAPGASLTDPNKTMPDRTTTEVEALTILEGQEALPQQNKGTSQDSRDIILNPSERSSEQPTPNSSNPQSLVGSRLSDGGEGNYDVDVTDAENRKRQTKRGRGRSPKKQYKKEVPGASLTDPNRTMLNRTTTEVVALTISEGQEALPQQNKGTGQDSGDIILNPSERSSDQPTPNSSNPQSFVGSRLSDGAQGNDEINQQKGGVVTRQSEALRLELSAEDFIYKTPCREVVVATRTEYPLKTSEIDTFSNVDDVPPLSMLSTESISPSTADDLPHDQVDSQSNMTITWGEASLNGEKDEDTSKQMLTDNCDEVISEDGKLPFEKSYSVWGTFETMEIFQAIPQSPHFRPLAELHERLREGQAIGYMFSYADVAEKTRKTQLDESDISIAEKLEALEELESIGFNVRSVRDRLENLRRIKSVLVQLDVELKQAETKIIKEKLEEESQKSLVQEADESTREMQESIIKLKKRQMVLMAEKLVKESNIIRFQKHLKEVEEKKHELNLDFDRVAAAPW